MTWRKKTFDFWFRSSHSIFTNPLSPFQVQLHTDHSQLCDTKHSPIRDHTCKRQQTFSPISPELHRCTSLLFRRWSIRTSDHLLPSYLLHPRQLSVNREWLLDDKGHWTNFTWKRWTRERRVSGSPRVSRPRKVIESARGASAERPSRGHWTRSETS